MKKAIVFIAATVALATLWAAPVAVGLKISKPQTSVSKSGSDKPKGANRRGTHKATEIKNSVFEYKGKVSCTPPKDTTVTVTLEAYFITRSIGNGAQDELSSRKEIDKYEFGGDYPKTYDFTLTTPAITQTTVTTVKTSGHRRRGGGSSSTSKDKSGTRLMGVIVRAMVDGKPVKVVTEPSNSRWEAAAKKDTIEL